MSKHWHLVLDLNTGDTEILALPAEGGGGGTTSAEVTSVLSGVIDGHNRVFALPVKVVHSPPAGYQIKLYHGGRRILSDDFVVFESVIGGGLDRVRLKWFAPRANDVTADYVPAP